MIWYFGSDEAVLAGEFHVDLAKLPAVADASPARKPMLVKLALAIAWMVASAIFLAPAMTGPFQIRALMIAVPMSGLIVIAMALSGLLRQRYISFDKDGVQVHDRRWFWRSKWSAPYTAFLGVASRKHVVSAALEDSLIHIAELSHMNPKLSLPLLVSSDGPPAKKNLMGAARLFGIPLLKEEPEKQLEQQFQRLNKPIAKIAKTYDLANLYDPREPVPRDLKIDAPIKDSEGLLRVTLRPHRMKPLWRLLLLAGATYSTAVTIVTSNLAIIGSNLIFLILATILLVGSLLHSRRLRISRQTLICESPWWRPSAKRLIEVPLSEIDGIHIKTSPSGHGNILEIERGRERIQLGNSLSPASLDWLRRFLIAAIATA